MVAVTSNRCRIGIRHHYRSNNSSSHAVENNNRTTRKQVEKQGEMFVHAMERLENRIDKRIDEVRSEVSEMRSELSRLNQNHIDHLTHHQHRTED